jgi:hypothetical protein
MAGDDDVHWTAKLPALVAGVVLVILGLVSLRGNWRYAFAGGALLILAGGGFIGWSLTIKEWCAARDMPHSAFSSAFSGSFHSCLRQKGWLEF